MGTRSFVGVLCAVLFMAGCAAPPETESEAGTGAPPAGEAGAPTLSELADATYGPFDGQTVTLTNGRWEGEPFVEGGASLPIVWLSDGVYLAGDLDGDGSPEAVTHLTYSAGGTGNFGYLAVMSRDAGGVVQRGLAEIGDRVALRSVRVDSGKIVLDVLQVGPSDGMCCPTQLATRSFELRETELVDVGSEVTGTASLTTLAGTRWRLTRLSADEDVSALPAITIAFGADGLSGSGGCNDFEATVAQGEGATDLVIGPLTATEKSCEPELVAPEERVLEMLEGAESWGFQFGDLVLNYQRDGTWGTLFFEPI